MKMDEILEISQEIGKLLVKNADKVQLLFDDAVFIGHEDFEKYFAIEMMVVSDELS